MPRELFCGGELECFTYLSGAPSTLNSNFDAAFSVTSISLIDRSYQGTFTDSAGAPSQSAPGSVVWAHFYSTSYSQGATIATLRRADGRPSARVIPFGAGAGAPTLQLNSSATATATWVTVAAFTGGSGYFDFSIDTGTGVGAFYVNGNLVGTDTVPNAAGSISSIQIGPSDNSASVSQVLVTEDISTVGARVWTRKASGAGALQQMTGAYTNLVKTQINDTTSVTSGTAGQVALYEYQDIATPEGLAIGEVWEWTRAKNDGSAPLNLRGVVRVGGTDYDNPTAMPMLGGFNSMPSRWPLNPATSAKWTEASFNAAQIGMKSET